MRTSALGQALLAARHADVADARERVQITRGAFIAAELVLTTALDRLDAHGAVLADGSGAAEAVLFARRALSAAGPVKVATRWRRRRCDTDAILGHEVAVAGCSTVLCKTSACD